MKYFTSDLHFGHKNVLSYCQRPFKDLEEMHEMLVKNWNEQVSQNDVIYVLGDFSLSPKWVDLIVPQLNGEKHLIYGNHDQVFKGKLGQSQEKTVKMIECYYAAGWKNITVQQSITLGIHHVLMSHFPYAPKKDDNHNTDIRYLAQRLPDNGQFLLHGHLHCRYIKNNNMIDVGIDNNFKLLSESDIITIIEDERKFIPSRLTEWYTSEEYKKQNEERKK